MNLKKVLVLLLAVTMLIVAAVACGSPEADSGTTPASDPATTTPADTDEPAGDDGDAATGDAAALTPVRFIKPGNEAPDTEAGFEAINAKLHADGLNIEVSTIRIPWDVYQERLSLLLSAGDPFELLHIMQDVRNLASLAGIGAVTSIEPYIGQFPNLEAFFNEFEWRGTMVDGDRFAVPAIWRSFEMTGAIAVRTDAMRAVGYDEFPTHDLDAVVDLMQLMQEYILDETGIRAYHWLHQLMALPMWLHRTYDTFPFHVEPSLGLVMIRQDGTVDSWYESEEFKQDANFFRHLFELGLIHPDVLSVGAQMQWDQGNLGAHIPGGGAQPSTTAEVARNTDIVGATFELIRMFPEKPDLLPLFVANMNGVSSTADDPVAALSFLDWLYASPENHDLYHYGIEGVHWHDRGPNRAEFVFDDAGDRLFLEDYWMTAYMGYFRHGVDMPDNHIDFLVV
jgi:putative aldouronate transport system substrate-binding protein